MLVHGSPFLPLQSLRDSSPKGELFEVEVKFLVAFDTLVTRLTAYALSVKAYGFDSSPKGRAKSTTGNFLISPNTLATSLRPWLPL